MDGNSEVFVANVVTVDSDKPHVTPTETNSLLKQSHYTIPAAEKATHP
jgi:hypothetical protein